MTKDQLADKLRVWFNNNTYTCWPDETENFSIDGSFSLYELAEFILSEVKK